MGIALGVVYVLVASVLPLVAFTDYFQGNDGWYLVRLYGHQFLYPFVGALLVLLVVRAGARIGKYAAPPAKTALRVVTAILVLGGVAYEMVVKPGALHEIPREKLGAPICTAEASEEFVTTCRQALTDCSDRLPVPEMSDQVRCTNAAVALAYIKGVTPDNELSASTRLFSCLLPCNSVDAWNEQGPTEHHLAYLVSFAATLLVFVGTLTTCLLGVATVAAGRVPSAGESATLLRQLLGGYILGLPWFIWYLSWTIHRAVIMGGAAAPASAYAIALIFLLVGLVLTYQLIRSDSRGTIDKAMSAVSFVASLGFGSLIFSKEWALNVFPRAPDLPHLLLLGLVAVALAVAPLMAVLSERDDEDDEDDKE